VDDIGSFGTFDASGAFMSKDVRLMFCYFVHRQLTCDSATLPNELRLSVCV